MLYSILNQSLYTLQSSFTVMINVTRTNMCSQESERITETPCCKYRARLCRPPVDKVLQLVCMFTFSKVKTTVTE